MNKFSALLVSLWVALLLSACGGKSVEEQLAEAEQSYVNGDMRRTLLDSREVLQREPDNARARMLRALSAKAMGDFGTAEADFERALAAGVDDPRLVLGLGDLYLIMQQPQKTIDLLQSNDAIVEKNLDVALLAVDAALVMRDAGRADVELDLIREAHSAAGRNEVVLRELQLLVLNGEIDAAAEKAEALRVAAPSLAQVFSISAGIAQYERRFGESARFHQQAADLWRAQGQLFREINARNQASLNYLEANMIDAATESIEIFESLSPQSAPAKFLRAALLIKMGDVESANALLREANSASPRNTQYLRMLGLSELSLGNFGQAEQHLRVALRENPTDPVVRNAMAEIALRQGRVGDALEILREIDGSGPGYTARLGQALLLDGQVDEAISLLKRYSDEGPADWSIQMVLARAYAQKGDLPSAESLLADAMNADDQDYTAAMTLISSYMARGDTGSAEALTEELLADRADDPRAYGTAAWFLYAIGRTEEAISRAREAANLFPDSAIAQSLLGNLSIANDDLSTADTALAKVLDIEPENINALLDMARLRQLQDQPEASIALLEQADTLADRDFRPAMALTRIALRGEQIEQALRWSDRMTELAPDRASALALRAAVLEAAGQNESSMATMQRAVQQSDASPRMFRTLARLQAAAGDGDASQVTLERGLTRFSGDPTLRAEKALQALARGELDLAEKEADALLADRPDDSVVLLIKGQVHLRRGEANDARLFFERAEKAGAGAQAVIGRYTVANQAREADAIDILRAGHERYPESPVLALFLAGAEQSSGNRAPAMRLYEHVLERAPDSAVALNNLAWMLNEDGKRDEALELSRRAVEVAPDAPDVLDTYGVVLLASDDVEQAVAVLEKAYTLSAENQEIRYHLAQALYKAGDTSLAAGHLRAIIDSDARTDIRSDASDLLARLSQE